MFKFNKRMDIKSAEGTLMIDVSSNSSVVNISLRIPQQVIYLRSYRVEFDTAAHALASQILYVDLPFLSGNQLLDTNPGRTLLPILLDNAIVSFAYGKDIPVYLSSNIPQTFPVKLYDSSFNLVSNLVRCSLVFSLQKGSLV